MHVLWGWPECNISLAGIVVLWMIASGSRASDVLQWVSDVVDYSSKKVPTET